MGGQGSIRMALACAALLASLTLVVWRQSRALEVLRDLDATRQARAIAESEKSAFAHDIQRLESRKRVLQAASARLSMRVPAATEIVIVGGDTTTARAPGVAR